LHLLDEKDTIVQMFEGYPHIDFKKEPPAATRGGPGRWDQHPFVVIWEVTRACALACRHCRAEAQPRRNPCEVDGAAAHDLIDQVARARPAIFILTGGDPMCRPDLPELIEYASGLGLRVALSPSATPRWLRADLPGLKECGLQGISLSLDGACEETHDAFRGVKGTWKRTMLGYEAARDAGLSIQINTTITKQNLGELDEFVELLSDMEPKMWSVFQLIPTGRAESADMIDGHEMEALFERLADLSGEVPFAIKTTEGHHFRRVMIQKGKFQRGAPGLQGIGDGKGFVFISHAGEIFPSGFLPMNAGNVRSDELIDVYRDNPLFRSLRDPGQLKGKCARCEFRVICGGSRARAFGMTGDALAADPLCIYQPREHSTPATPIAL
jgi:radical SAM protein with 4Fe4S-binding SPASM domain